MATNTTTANPDEPENGEEPFTLSDAEVTALANVSGVRSDVVRSVKGNDYSEVRANLEKIYDMAPGSRTVQPAKVDNRDKLDGPALAALIRRRLNKGGVQ